MKNCFMYYILDCAAETVSASFVSPNDIMAKRNFEAFIKKLPDVVRENDYYMLRGASFEVLETFDEVSAINDNEGKNFVCYGDEFCVQPMLNLEDK